VDTWTDGTNGRSWFAALLLQQGASATQDFVLHLEHVARAEAVGGQIIEPDIGPIRPMVPMLLKTGAAVRTRRLEVFRRRRSKSSLDGS